VSALATSTSKPTHNTVWLEHQSSCGKQRLGLVPTLGGSVAAWQLARDGSEPFDLFRPWDGLDYPDEPLRVAQASYPLVPWSNRISQGGFTANAQFHRLAPNAAGQTYPIHGDGFLQSWQFKQRNSSSLDMALESKQFNGNPHHYSATQTFQLLDDGMAQSICVTHLGDAPLPYGLGLHPWLPRNEQTTLQAKVDGVWLSHADCLPKAHTADFLASWDLNISIPAAGTLIDNCYTGWDGAACVTWPDQNLQLNLRQQQSLSTPSEEASTYLVLPNYLLIFRKVTGDHFCIEPVSHPIDACHLPGQPGLQMLEKGESLTLALSWRFKTTPT
jgi:aldose 1-epimerase